MQLDPTTGNYEEVYDLEHLIEDDGHVGELGDGVDEGDNLAAQAWQHKACPQLKRMARGTSKQTTQSLSGGSVRSLIILSSSSSAAAASALQRCSTSRMSAPSTSSAPSSEIQLTAKRQAKCWREFWAS